MKSFKSLILYSLVSVVIVIVLLQLGLQAYVTKRAMSKASEQSLMMALQQIKLHFEYRIFSFTQKVRHFASDEEVVRYVVDDSSLNKRLVEKKMVSETFGFDKSNFAILNANSEYIYKTSSFPVTSSNSNAKYLKLLSGAIEKEYATSKIDGEDYLIIALPIRYRDYIEGVFIAAINLESEFEYILASFGSNFGLELKLNGEVFLTKGHLTNFKKVAGIKQLSELKIVISLSEEMIQNPIADLYMNIAIITVIVLAISIFLLVVWVTPRLTSPLLKLEKEIRNVAKKSNGHVKTSVNLNEVRRVEDEFNLLLDKLHVVQEENIAKAHKSGMGEIAVNVLHNIGNVITGMSLRISDDSNTKFMKQFSRILEKINGDLRINLNQGTLEDYLTNDERGRKTLDMLGEIILKLDERAKISSDDHGFLENRLHNIASIISSQQNIANSGIKIKTKNNLRELVNEAIEIESTSCRKRGIALSYNDEDVYVKVDRFGMSQVLVNLIVNAIESIDGRVNDDPAVNPHIQIKTMVKENMGVVVIKDNGTGISESALNSIFKRGYSTKDRSSGFGLHNCANVIKSNNGSIEVMSEGKNKGATFQVMLPLQS